MATSSLAHISLGPIGMIPPVLGATAASAMVLDAATERLAWKFYAEDNASITHLDVRLIVVGTVTGHTYTLAVQTDSSDAPSGVLVGAATAAFAGPAATGFLGEQALLTPTGALVTNTPYWAVLQVATGIPDGLNSVQASYATTTPINREKMRHHNGTNWTTTTAANQAGLLVRKTAGGEYRGYPMLSAVTTSGAPDIYTNAGTIQRQGVKFKVGATVTIRGVDVRFAKAGSPGDLICKIYAGSVEQSSETIPAADITNAGLFTINFSSPPTIPAGTTGYITFQQGGTSDAADYDLACNQVQSTYISAIGWSELRYIHGTGVDPTTHTVIDTFAPVCAPFVGDPAADLTGTAPAATNIFTTVLF